MSVTAKEKKALADYILAHDAIDEVKNDILLGYFNEWLKTAGEEERNKLWLKIDAMADFFRQLRIYQDADKDMET